MIEVESLTLSTPIKMQEQLHPGKNYSRGVPKVNVTAGRND
jgi:hypothetical protein